MLDLAERLNQFASNPDKLVSAYQEDIIEDPLLNKIMDVEEIALELNDMAKNILNNAMYNSLGDFQKFALNQAINSFNVQEMVKMLKSKENEENKVKQESVLGTYFKPRL